MNDKVLLTGATGFLGSHLAGRLIQKKYQLVCSMRKTSNLQFISDLDFRSVEVDWTDPETIYDLVDSVDYIIHCAGVTKALHLEDYYKGNVVPTLMLLKAAKKSGRIKRFVFISSQAAIGPSPDSTPITEDFFSGKPITDYGQTKLKAEIEVLNFKNEFPVTIIRPCSIYGPGDHEFYPLFKLVKRHLKTIVGNGKKQLNMIHVSDLAHLIIKSIEIEHPNGSIFFATDGKIYDWNTLFKIVQDVYGKWALKIRLPLFILKYLGMFNDRISKITKKPALLNSQKIKEMIPDFWLCDSTKAQKTFNFKPKYDLKAGFKETLEWYQKEKWL